MPQDRQALRQHLRQQRRALSPQQQRQASQALAQRLIDQPEMDQAGTIALYLANDGEPNLMPLIRLLWQQHKPLALPVMHPNDPERIQFQRFAPDSAMVNNRYGIAEPAWAESDTLPREQIDLMLMPLVGFDEQGNRLGMGAGYYDRYLAGKGSRPLLVGCAHECQRLEGLESAPWDIPLDAVVTPERWLTVRNCS
ncbi:5-formyltetrahydrofolate cyclo-ligase [Ferrimonas futtsuensis]|uniref:5-formyltetrahydrofolate cyclo-ligase n=1 Tax=Ferrimonas futtsuensis TaxID=364764 RepID=UPI0004294825|nr:5-formyltetrahydrofolate cyclo-ligase [Ferrimonas futtsuensis]